MGIFPKKKRRHNAYCAFCRTPRVVSRKRNISFGNVFGAMLASPILMWLLWGGPDARVFVIFACLLGVAEYFVQLRWRMSVICRACGFDPVLYLKSPEKAAELVKKKLEDRQVNGVDLIQGPLQIPRLTPERAQTLARLEEMKKSKPGSLVSREI